MEFYIIASGSTGNSIYIADGRHSLLIDAGISCKRITEALHAAGHSLSDIDAVLVTHEHSDHISGLGVLMRKTKVPVYATAPTIRQILRYPSLGNVDSSLLRPIEADRPFVIGDMKAEAFRLSHDAAEPVGYRVEADGRAAAVATDMGCFSSYTVAHLQDLDTVLVEANHDEKMLEAGPYPYPLKQRILSERGHLSNVSAGMLMSRILNDHMKAAYIGHLSRTNNYDALAYATVSGQITMDETCPYREGDFDIRVAAWDRPSPLLDV